MRIALLLIMLFSGYPSFALEKSSNGLSCEEVLEVVKQSDCAEMAKPFLDGAYVTAGLSISSLSITVFDNSDSNTLAELNDSALPLPFIAFHLKPSFFGKSNFGWGVGFDYSNAYALEQSIIRSGDTKNVDLGTYITTTLFALTPNAFYQFGDQYSDRYFRIGVGAAIGYAHIRGTAFFTEDESNSQCYQAGSDFVDGTGPATEKLRIEAIKDTCQQENYNQGGLGLGASVFMQGQYKNWQVSIDSANLLLSQRDQKLQPAVLSLQVAYVIPL